jgi:hypothetical protein
MTTDPKRKLEDMLQIDLRQFVEQQLGVAQWVPVYGHPPSAHGTLFSALIPNTHVKAALDNMGWDLMIGQGTPGISISFGGGKEERAYHRLGDYGGIEPLVLVRDFHGLRPSYPEISEEFRLFHNLFHDTRTNTYLKFTDSGDEEEVIRFRDGGVQIRLKELRQFLAIKEMHLALYFDLRRHSPESLATLNPDGHSVVFRNELMRYEVVLGELTFGSDGERTFSRLIGKKLIPPLPKEQSNFWPYEQRKSHAEFIVGVDAAGEPVLFSSDPDKLSNYFTEVPGAPHYLTPIFFKREVLAKYFAKPTRYEVTDGRLTCAGLWSVQIDTEFKDHVAVFLGDLGRDLPYDDQLYWKTFNLPPQGNISATNFKRSFLAQFTDPEHPELVFKAKYERFRKGWSKRFGWDLLKPLGAEDAHLFSTLRVPLQDEQGEFDEQVLALTKILVDSLNERELEGAIPPQPENTKGISKLKVYLESKGMPDAQQQIKFLRNLQSLRMGGAHRKGEDYRKAAATFGMDEKTLRVVFDTVFRGAIALLDALERHFLVPPPPTPPATA